MGQTTSRRRTGTDARSEAENDGIDLSWVDATSLARVPSGGLERAVGTLSRENLVALVFSLEQERRINVQATSTSFGLRWRTSSARRHSESMPVYEQSAEGPLKCNGDKQFCGNTKAALLEIRECRRQFKHQRKQLETLLTEVAKLRQFDLAEASSIYACPICLDSFDEASVGPKGLRQISCGHIYCETCLNEQMMMSLDDQRVGFQPMRCPVCRAQYSPPAAPISVNEATTLMMLREQTGAPKVSLSVIPKTSHRFFGAYNPYYDYWKAALLLLLLISPLWN
eukprot:Clim_evm92s210 gene=Clim_evmTU92s210